MKLVQQALSHHQLWLVLSSLGTLGGFIVALAVLVWPDPDGGNKDANQRVLDPSISSLVSAPLPRGDAGFYLLLDEGVDFLRAGDLGRALQSFDDAINRIPADRPDARDQAFAYLMRGAADLLSGERVYAITDFKSAFERGDDAMKSVAAGAIGITYLELGDLYAAEDWLLTARADYGNRLPDVIAGLGYLAFARGDYRVCEEEYSHAIQSPMAGPSMQRYLNGRALCTAALRDYQDALLDVEAALDLGGPMDAMLLDFRQDLLRKCGGQCQ